MKRQIYNILQKSLAGFMTVMLALILWAGISAVPVKAASGSVYTCTINRCYAHPVTGTIEDSGGEASYTTGQGMVEGCVYSGGMLEVAEAGQYYLTIRVGLMDYTTNQSFQVQNVGDSGWSSTGTAVTGTGSDSNGATADVCIQVPSENCVVRGSMYVTPMGRDVIFYLYPSNYSPGNSSGMNATMVTESSGGTDTNGGSGADTSGGSETDTANNQTVTTDNNVSAANETTAGTGSTASAATGATASTGNTEGTGSTGLQSSITKAATPDSSEDATDSKLNDVQGLSLSTRVEGEEADSGSGNSTVNQAIVLAAAITISGLILLAVAAIVVYYYRRNWKRWGGEDDDDEDDE
ncbi:MAG: heme-binding Shp domain-containing protein [Lachnospiraceae bacterium]|nr:heme-binding Shp domain-containing protein [Lachnospiraceae bacterium]